MDSPQGVIDFSLYLRNKKDIENSIKADNEESGFCPSAAAASGGLSGLCEGCGASITTTEIEKAEGRKFLSTSAAANLTAIVEQKNYVEEINRGLT